MKIAAICCTYKRPKILAEAINCFTKQEYPEHLREMIILDDAGQYDRRAMDGIPGVRLVVSDHRFRTLGEKRNASAALASPDVDAYCVWDDDDIYLPWHMSAAAMSLANADYAIPTILYIDKVGRLEIKKNSGLFHGSWSFTRKAFDDAGGYPFIQSGQDQGILVRFKSRGLRRSDPLEHFPPSYVYRWYTAHDLHISAMGRNGYERLSKTPFDAVSDLPSAPERDWLRLHSMAWAEHCNSRSKVAQ